MNDAISMSPSVWEHTTDFDYMAAPARASHASHDTVTKWLADTYQSSRFSLLDCGVLSAVTWNSLRAAGSNVRYIGIDVSEPVIQDCRNRAPEATWLAANVTDLDFDDESFDVVYARHLLEGLPYYETAVREIFRVSRAFVIICFFQPPADPERLLRRVSPDGHIWLNRYSPEPFERLISSLSTGFETVDVVDGGIRNRIYICAK